MDDSSSCSGRKHRHWEPRGRGRGENKLEKGGKGTASRPLGLGLLQVPTFCSWMDISEAGCQNTAKGTDCGGRLGGWWFEGQPVWRRDRGGENLSPQESPCGYTCDPLPVSLRPGGRRPNPCPGPTARWLSLQNRGQGATPHGWSGNRPRQQPAPQTPARCSGPWPGRMTHC